MPFTPSHAVVALPFVRTPLIPAAIAVGAMTPDLPLFVRVTPLSYAVTHDAAWLPVTMLLALVLLVVWRCVVRPGARELLPAPIAGRLPAEWDAGPAAAWRETFAPSGRTAVRDVLLLLVSLALGVVSHIIWDLFTHEGRWGSEIVPALALAWGPLPGYRWLQHGSGAIAGAALLVWAVRWLARRALEPATRVLPGGVRVIVWLALPALMVSAAGWGLAEHGPIDSRFTLAHLAYLTLPPACALWGVGVLGVCAAVPFARRRQDSESPA